MSKIELKEIPKDDHARNIIGHLETQWNLAQNLDLAGYIFATMKMQALMTNLSSMILCALHGEKGIYEKIKAAVEHGFKDFIESHDQIVKEEFKKKKKGTH